MTIYLYKKTHNKTVLQYLGKTKQNPFKYVGSGTDWKTHLKEHGNDVTTEILNECQSDEELNYWGRYYSELWNIVERSDWANRIPETGAGQGRKIGTIHSEETRKKISEKAKLRPQMTEEHRRKIGLSGKGRVAWNKGIPLSSIYSKENRSLKYGSSGEKNPMYGKAVPKKVCPHCNKEVDIRNFSRSHGDRCKFK